jgi:type IV secretory pathway VirB10-like protein
MSFRFIYVIILSLALGACGKKAEQPAPDQPKVDPLKSLMDMANEQKPPAPAVLIPSSSSLNFTGLKVGDDMTLPLTLSNTGQALTIKDIRLAGEGETFSVTGTCTQGIVLQKDTPECVLEITFKPREARTYQTSLMVIHDATNSPLLINLLGVSMPSIQDNTDALPSADLMNAREVMNSRRRGKLTVMNSNVATQLSDEYDMSSDDYSDIGYIPTTATYPVNRERMITADRFIPVVLENTINSQLPDGRATAVIETHVYSSEGRNIIIPAGSRVIGKYKSLQKRGQTRLDIVWSRILRPDGVGIDVQSPSVDQMGRAGLPGDIDNRYFDRYGVPLLMSTMAILANYAASPSQVTSSTFNTPGTGILGTTTSETLSRENVAVRSFGAELLDTANQIVRENVQIDPVVTVPAGTRFYITPTKDIVLKSPTLLTSAGDSANDLIAQARGLIRGLQKGDLEASSEKLVQVLGLAAKAGMINEQASLKNGFNRPDKDPSIATGADNYEAPPTRK